MGLLDQHESSDDLVFPNFDLGTTTPTPSIFDKQGPPTNTSNPPSPALTSQSTKLNPKPSAISMAESTSTAASSTTSTSQAPISTPRSARHMPRRATCPQQPPRKPALPRRTRSESKVVFDLYGEDEALQDAVPRIHFCDICLCACDVH